MTCDSNFLFIVTVGDANGPYFNNEWLTNSRQDITNLAHDLGTNVGYTANELSLHDAKLHCPYPRGEGSPSSIVWSKGNTVVASYDPSNDRLTIPVCLCINYLKHFCKYEKYLAK